MSDLQASTRSTVQPPSSLTISSTRSRPSGRCVMRRTDRSLRRREDVAHERLGGRRVEVRGRLVEERGRARRRGARGRPRAAGAGRRRAAPPSSPTSVSSPSGSDATHSPRRTRPSASPELGVASPRVGRARRFSRIVASKTCASWPASANVAAHVLLPVARGRRGRRSSPALLRVEEPQQQVRDRRLARAARPDEGDAPARLEAEVDAAAGRARQLRCSARSRPRARRPAARAAARSGRADR